MPRKRLAIVALALVGAIGLACGGDQGDPVDGSGEDGTPSNETLAVAGAEEMAERYAAAWSSQDPASLAAFYAANGRLQVNDGEPAIGRAAIEEKASGFMEAFPDMVVRLRRFDRDGDRAVFHWHWLGTATGPGGNGAAVNLTGYEEWTLDGEGKILQSLGHYDEAEYERQMSAGGAASQ
jgi:uncharacterized protein (TIGR02246 family)